MKIGFVIPSRLKSSRLKKKIMLNLSGRSALEWAILRAKASKSIDEVIVSTSYLNIDEPITKICLENNIRYFQGDPDDVLKRLRDTAIYFDLDYIVNITPDNTLFSMNMIDIMVSEIKENPSGDFFKFKDPVLGTGIYALKREALQTACEFKKLHDTEIWGPIFQSGYYNNIDLEIPEIFKADYRLTMDTPDDYVMLSKLYSMLNISENNLVELHEVIQFLNDHKEVADINGSIKQRSLDSKIIEKIRCDYQENEDEFYRIKSLYY